MSVMASVLATCVPEVHAQDSSELPCAAAYLQEAVRKGCSMLFLPECCAFIGRNREEVRPDGPVFCSPCSLPATWPGETQALAGLAAL